MWPEDVSWEMTLEERAIQELLRDAHLAADHELPRLFVEHATALAVRDPVAYVVDLQQHLLIPFVQHDEVGFRENVEALGIDSTLAGRAFQHVEVLTQPLEHSSPEIWVWLFLLDGTERLGLLGVTAPSLEALEANDGVLRARLARFAAIAAELIMTKTMYGDTLVRLRRTGEMGLAAEMQWSLLPPLTFASPYLTVAAGLEPAYSVAGDTVDYAVNGTTAHLAIFDGVGHGLHSAQLAALTVAAYRNARRAGRSLSATAEFIEEAVVAGWHDDVFITGQVVELDVSTGRLEWINAGHPDPLLIRGGRLIRELHAPPRPPFGMADLVQPPTDAVVGAEMLEPGDLIVLYSDGVTEGRSPDGQEFGVDRLVDLLVRNIAAGLPPPETTRRAIRSLLQHQQSQLADDATLALVQYRPPRQSDLLP